MEEKQMDRRVRHTRQRLRDALLALMKSKRISEISPTELCRKADINRNTFYAHFSCPGELLASIEDELYAEIQESVLHSLGLDSTCDPTQEICEWIQQNRAVYEVLLSGKGDSSFAERVLFLGREKSIKDWKKAAPSLSMKTLNSLYLFVSNGAVALINAWIRETPEDNPEQVADLIEQISMAGVKSFFKPR